MIKYIKKLGFVVLYTFLGLVSFLLVYLLFALLFTWIPVNSSQHVKKIDRSISIWVIGDEMHTDLCLPIENEEINWKNFLDTSNSFSKNQFNYACFGWGDKNFFLKIPRWSDLTFSIAFRAGCGLSSSAMRVTCYTEVPVDVKYKRKLNLSTYEYQALVTYIQQSFFFEGDQNKPILIDRPSWESENIFFYEARGTYSIFYTCNSWTNGGLKEIGIKTATWAPFPRCVFYHLDK